MKYEHILDYVTAISGSSERPTDPGVPATPRLLPHHEHGALGDVLVVPDHYDEPVPAGAIRETDYRAMTTVFERIAHGKSGIGFDTSSFTAGKDLLHDPLGYAEGLLEAGDFRGQYLDYIRDLVKTPSGLRMLERLDGAKHRTTITPGIGTGNQAVPVWADANNPDDELANPELRRRNGRPNVGTDVQVYADPTQQSWKADEDLAEEPWMKDRPRFGFYHELVHAYDYVAGEGARNYHGRGRGCWPIGESEWRAVGLGPYAHAPVSENRIRQDMEAPLRPTYGGVTYEGSIPYSDQHRCVREQH